MLEYARWKYILVAAVLLLALVFALPNVFGEDPALQVARKDHAAVAPDAAQAVETFLKTHGVRFEKSYLDAGRLMVRFASVPDQLAARDAVNGNEEFKNTYITALSFAPRTPEVLRQLGLKPMPLGLDGGLILIPSEYHLTVSAPGLRTRPTERDDAGNQLRTFDLDAVAAGQTLRLTVHGLPTHDRIGKWIAGVLVALLILAGIVAAARPHGVAISLGEKAG